MEGRGGGGSCLHGLFMTLEVARFFSLNSYLKCIFRFRFCSINFMANGCVIASRYSAKDPVADTLTESVVCSKHLDCSNCLNARFAI